MALYDRPLVAFSLRVFATLLLLLALALVSSVGGVLNRCRGGYLNMDLLTYWPRHDISREVFSIPTGLLVLLMGKHFKAGLVVWLLTQCSLYVGWGTYMNIGTVGTNYMSREGIFDWMLARQLKDWNFTRRFVREYSGMSLRGLVWTLPQGYALQQFGFGWQYSLSGSLMGAVYYAGAESKFEPNNTDFFDSTIAHSEFYWGTFMWFVLIITCLSQLVYRTRRWVYHRSPSSVHNPYTRWEILKHVSLNYRWMRVCYEALVVLLWTVFTISIIFYSVTVQTDASNKGMTFAGLFLSVVALTFFLAWTWAIVYITHVFRRARQEERRIEIEKSKQSRTAPGINDIDHLEGGSGMGDRMSYTGEGDPLLPWPYSHPDKIFAKRTHSPVEQSRLSAGSSYGTYSQHSSVRQPPNGSTGLAFILLWPGIEKWLYLDIFSWLRHLIGLVSLCATMGTLLLTLITFFWNLKVFRFNPYYEVCPVSANITQIGT